jgi:hypothetical protein
MQQIEPVLKDPGSDFVTNALNSLCGISLNATGQRFTTSGDGGGDAITLSIPFVGFL